MPKDWDQQSLCSGLQGLPLEQNPEVTTKTSTQLDSTNLCHKPSTITPHAFLKPNAFLLFATNQLNSYITHLTCWLHRHHLNQSRKWTPARCSWRTSSCRTRGLRVPYPAMSTRSASHLQQVFKLKTQATKIKQSKDTACLKSITLHLLFTNKITVIHKLWNTWKQHWYVQWKTRISSKFLSDHGH